jgi:hypothetical protein
MVTFTREDRRGRVLEYHSQGMGTREIAKLLHMSFTDIGKILRTQIKRRNLNSNGHDRNFCHHKLTHYFLKEKVQYRWQLS